MDIAESIFENAVNATKAHGFDILSNQVQELKEENRILKAENKRLSAKNDDLLEEITEEWVWELSVCHQAGGKINDFESVMRNAMQAAFYRTQADSKD